MGYEALEEHDQLGRLGGLHLSVNCGSTVMARSKCTYWRRERVDDEGVRADERESQASGACPRGRTRVLKTLEYTATDEVHRIHAQFLCAPAP